METKKQLPNLLKRIVVGLPMLERLNSSLLSCKTDISQYARQKTLTDVWHKSVITCAQLI